MLTNQENPERNPLIPCSLKEQLEVGAGSEKDWDENL